MLALKKGVSIVTAIRRGNTAAELALGRVTRSRR
jgi:hypothetical protein